MPTAPPAISVSKAVICGLVFVYGVVMPLLVLAFALPPILLAAIFPGGLQGSTLPAWLVMAAVLWCIAWAAWSVLVPRWRLWAYRRVENLDSLRQAAVAVGLIWPEGHLFQKTEIASMALKRELARLEQEHSDRKSGVT
jgi:hypothetical protein